MQIITKPKKPDEAVIPLLEVTLLVQKHFKPLWGMRYNFFGSLNTFMDFAVPGNSKNVETLTGYELQKSWELILKVLIRHTGPKSWGRLP